MYVRVEWNEMNIIDLFDVLEMTYVKPVNGSICMTVSVSVCNTTQLYLNCRTFRQWPFVQQIYSDTRWLITGMLTCVGLSRKNNSRVRVRGHTHPVLRVVQWFTLASGLLRILYNFVFRRM